MKVTDNSSFLKELKNKNKWFREGDFLCLSLYKKTSDKIIVKDLYGYHRITPNSLLKGIKPSLKTAIYKYYYLKNILDVKNKKFRKRKYLLKGVNEDYTANVITKYGDCKCIISNLYKESKDIGIKSAKNKTEYAINEFREIYGDKYDYTDFIFISAKNKIKLHCDTHGYFYTNYYDHKQYRHCPNCSSAEHSNKSLVKRYDSFKLKADAIHNNVFIYDKDTFISQNKNIKITCKKCSHVFYRKPINHLNSDGCPICYNDYKPGSYKWWKKCCENKDAIFYILECWNDNESFYKIGITCNTIKNRYYKSSLMPYEYKIIFKYQSYNKELIYKTELLLKKNIKLYAYKPTIEFGGSKTECIDIKKLREDNIDIKQYSKKILEELYHKVIN